MLDGWQVERLRGVLCDRFTAEELCEILGLTVDDLFEAFMDRILQIDWTERL